MSDPEELFQNRMLRAIKMAGGPSELARKSGLSRRVIDKYKSGESDPSRERLVEIARCAGVSIAWLAAGEGSATLEKPQVSDIVTVPRYNAAASAGHGSFVEYAEKLDEIPFTEDFMLKRLGRTKTDGLIIVDAAGDSMEPTIRDGDLIMIDTDKTQLTAAIYAFTYEDSFFVKRLNHLPDAIEATSDNKGYAPFIVAKEQMNRVDILGRVVWVGHTP